MTGDATRIILSRKETEIDGAMMITVIMKTVGVIIEIISTRTETRIVIVTRKTMEDHHPINDTREMMTGELMMNVAVQAIAGKTVHTMMRIFIVMIEEEDKSCNLSTRGNNPKKPFPGIVDLFSRFLCQKGI